MDKEEVDKKISPGALESLSPAITASTESETFESWTLVTSDIPMIRSKIPTVQEAKESTKTKDSELKAHLKNDDDPHIEVIKKDDNHTDGEMSDGISIISDSESGGRTSPQPAPRRLSPIKRISPQRSVFTQADPDSDNPDDNIDSITFKPISIACETKAALLSTEPQTGASIATQSQEPDEASIDLIQEHPFLPRFNFTYAFYVATFIAILAIFGRMKEAPMFETRDLNAVYSKLNEILAKTSHIEAIIQDTINGLDDRSFDQYSNMLLRIKELNEKFEANNLAIKDALNQLTKPDKCPARNLDKPKKRIRENMHEVDYNKENRYGPEGEKPPNYSYPSQKKPRERGDESFSQEKSRRSPVDKTNKKFNSDGESPQSKEFGSSESKHKNGFEKHKPPHDQNDRKNGQKRQYESAERDSHHKNGYHEHDPRNKNGYKEKKSKHSNEHYNKNDYDTNSNEQNGDWMERRKRYREDARRNAEDDGKKRQSEEDNNWYLERGTSRQNARKFENVDK